MVKYLYLSIYIYTLYKWYNIYLYIYITWYDIYIYTYMCVCQLYLEVQSPLQLQRLSPQLHRRQVDTSRPPWSAHVIGLSVMVNSIVDTS